MKQQRSNRRLERLLKIAFLLAHEPLQRADLAARFGISERGISDDLALLRSSGVRITQTQWGYVATLPEEGNG